MKIGRPFLFRKKARTFLNALRKNFHFLLKTFSFADDKNVRSVFSDSLEIIQQNDIIGI